MSMHWKSTFTYLSKYICVCIHMHTHAFNTYICIGRAIYTQVKTISLDLLIKLPCLTSKIYNNKKKILCEIKLMHYYIKLKIYIFLYIFLFYNENTFTWNKISLFLPQFWYSCWNFCSLLNKFLAHAMIFPRIHEILYPLHSNTNLIFFCNPLVFVFKLSKIWSIYVSLQY